MIALATSRGLVSASSMGSPSRPPISWVMVSFQPARVLSQKIAAVTASTYRRALR